MQDEGSELMVWLLAEGLVLVLSLARILVVAVVLAVNVAALHRPCRVSTGIQCRCLHHYVSDTVKICSILYIASWLPFLCYSLLDGRWVWMDEELFCVVQNYTTNAVLLVLMAAAALAAWNRLRRFRAVRPAVSAGLTLAAWILPQATHFVVATATQRWRVEEERSAADFDFLDDLLGSGDGNHTSLAGITYKIGFTICGQKLSRPALLQYLLQYALVVAPLTLLCCGLVLLYWFRRCRRYASLDRAHPEGSESQCSCGTSSVDRTAIEWILGAVVLWMAGVRPAVLVAWSQRRLFVDVGSHLMLTIAAVFVPILPKKMEHGSSDSQTTADLADQLMARQVKLHQKISASR